MVEYHKDPRKFIKCSEQLPEILAGVGVGTSYKLLHGCWGRAIRQIVYPEVEYPLAKRECPLEGQRDSPSFLHGLQQFWCLDVVMIRKRDQSRNSNTVLNLIPLHFESCLGS